MILQIKQYFCVVTIILENSIFHLILYFICILLSFCILSPFVIKKLSAPLSPRMGPIPGVATV